MVQLHLFIPAHYWIMKRFSVIRVCCKTIMQFVAERKCRWLQQKPTHRKIRMHKHTVTEQRRNNISSIQLMWHALKWILAYGSRPDSWDTIAGQRKTYKADRLWSCRVRDMTNWSVLLLAPGKKGQRWSDEMGQHQTDKKGQSLLFLSFLVSWTSLSKDQVFQDWVGLNIYHPFIFAGWTPPYTRRRFWRRRIVSFFPSRLFRNNRSFVTCCRIHQSIVHWPF